jgi:hypothetical protein
MVFHDWPWRSNRKDENGLVAVDLIRMMLQGASVVRFANSKLDAYKEKKNFVFVAIYIDSSRKADRYLLYQDENAKIHPHHPDNVRTHVRYLLKS